MIRALFSTLILSSIVVTAAGAAGELTDPVTYQGKHVLQKTDLVVRGSVRKRTRMGTGVLLVSFDVTEVLYGKTETTQINLLSADPTFLPEKHIASILFLTHLSDERYEPMGRIDIDGREGIAKYETLKEYIAIEAIEDGVLKREKLKTLLLANLLSADRFKRYSAARELAAFTKAEAGYFTAADAALLEERAGLSRDPLFREFLRSAVRNIAPATPEPGPELEKPVESQPTKTTLPAPREFRELLARWRGGGLPDAERIRVILLVTAQYLKYGAPILLDALADPDPRIRRVAALNLGEAKVESSVAPLVRLLAAEKDPEVLQAAIQSLGVLRAEEALIPIQEVASVNDLTRAAVFAAARIGTPAALEYVEGVKAARTAPTREDRELRELVDYLLSPDFKEQEAALEKVRQKRLR